MSKLKMFEREAGKAVRNAGRMGFPFCGRDTELQKVNKLLTSSDKTVVLLHGLKQIGKSRLMLKLMTLFIQESDYLCCYHNFKRGRESLLTCLNKCLDPDGSSSLPDIGAIARDLGDYAEETEKSIVFFLDDVDKDRSQSGDTGLKEFLKEVSEVSDRVKFVLTSTSKMSFAGPFYESFEVGPLDDKAMTDLVFEVVEKVVDRDVDEVYVKAVARLCEGLPVAAILMGNEMHDDEGLLLPSDLLELLITNRIHALSPDYYPPSDRVGEVYQESYTSLDSVFKDMFDSLSESMTSNQFLVRDAVDAVGICDASDGLVKKQYLQPLVKRSILSVSGSDRSSREKSLKLHNIFRDCIVAQREKSDSKLQQQLKLSQESARSIGLDLPNSAIESPRSLARFIADMRSPNQDGMAEFDTNGDVRGDPMNIMSNPSVTSCCGPNAIVYTRVQPSDPLNCENRLSSNCDNCLSSNSDNCLYSNFDNNLPLNCDSRLPSKCVEATSCNSNGHFTDDKPKLTTNTRDYNVPPHDNGFVPSRLKELNTVEYKLEHPSVQEHSWIETDLELLKVTEELEHEHPGSERVKQDVGHVQTNSQSTNEKHQWTNVSKDDCSPSQCSSETSSNQMETMRNQSGTSMCGPNALPYTSVSNTVPVPKDSRHLSECINVGSSKCDNCPSFDSQYPPAVDFSLLSECDNKLPCKASPCDCTNLRKESCGSNVSSNEHLVDSDLKVRNIKDATLGNDKPVDCDISDCGKPEEAKYVFDGYQSTTQKQTSDTNQENGKSNGKLTDFGDCVKPDETKYVYEGYQLSAKKHTSESRPEHDNPADNDIRDRLKQGEAKNAGNRLATKKPKSKIPVRKGASSSNRKENGELLRYPRSSENGMSQSNVCPYSGNREEDSSLTERKRLLNDPRDGKEKRRVPTENDDITNNLNRDDSEKCISDKKPF